MNYTTRRSVLATVGSAVTAAASPVVGSAAVTDPADGRSMEEVGITQQVDDLMEEGRYGEASSLLSQHGVDYSIAIAENYIQPQHTGSDGISTADVMDGDTMRIVSGTMHLDDDIYRADLLLDMDIDEDLSALADCTGPDDIAAITYSSDNWEHEPGSQELGEHMSDFSPSSTGCSIRYDDYSHLAVGTEQYPRFRIDLEKTEVGQHNVYFHFSHSWKTCEPTGWGGITFGLQVGALNVEASGTVSEWTETETVEI